MWHRARAGFRGERQGRALAQGRCCVAAAAGGLCLAVSFFGPASARPRPSQVVVARAPEFRPPVTASAATPGFQVALDTPQEAKALCDRAGELLDQGTAGSGENQALTEAIDSCRRCLALLPRSEYPLDWAKTQIKLGIGLETLGERESGTARLEEALAAYREALQEFTPEAAPNWHDWAQKSLARASALLVKRRKG